MNLSQMKRAVRKQLDEWGDVRAHDMYKTGDRFGRLSHKQLAYNGRVNAALQEMYEAGEITCSGGTYTYAKEN